jgi:hypothetical protein
MEGDMVLVQQHTDHPQADDVLDRAEAAIGQAAIVRGERRLEEAGFVPIPKLRLGQAS